ncbi:MAG: hypothetical protein ACK4K7_09690 [Allosphingosinicella sp.]|uniref:hypothetical protein n=1 Tax=Allosphingosinicella sp. TaxID=2823234 RepID=UPI00395D43BE
MILSLRQALGLEFAMISTVLALMLSTAAQASDPVVVPRRAYNLCLSNFMRAQLRDGVDEAAFDTAIETACRDQESSLREAIIQRAMNMGDRRPVAERDAAAEIDDYQANARELFREHKENNTLPE